MLKIRDILRKHMGHSGPELIRVPLSIKKLGKKDEQIVLGQVYAPDCVDSHGDFMDAKELQNLAHSFMADGLIKSIDINHNNELVDAVVVESFIARKNDPDFDEGAWVVATKINDPVIWQKVKDGEVNGYSIEMLAFKEDLVVEVQFKSWYFGFTDPDPYDGHTHGFIVKLGERGEIVSGNTSIGSDKSSPHTISKTSFTDLADGHTHRFHLRD